MRKRRYFWKQIFPAGRAQVSSFPSLVGQRVTSPASHLQQTCLDPQGRLDPQDLQDLLGLSLKIRLRRQLLLPRYTFDYQAYCLSFFNNNILWQLLTFGTDLNLWTSEPFSYYHLNLPKVENFLNIFYDQYRSLNIF